MSKTILIIDDDADFITALQMDLELDGYVVETTSDPTAGLEEVVRCKPDIILIDWEMPEMTGIELVKRIKKDAVHRFCYIIMLTGRAGTENIVHALDAGADDFLNKPFHSDELRARIRSGLRIRLLEERIAEETKGLTILEMALSIADKIGNPIAAAKFYQQALIQNSSITKFADVNDSLKTLGQLLDEALGLMRKYQSVKPPCSIPTANKKTVTTPE